MISITRSFNVGLAAFLTFAALPSVTWAIPSGSNYMVSPPSCRPAESSIVNVSEATSASRLRLVNGAWTFKSGRTGYAELVCPINFSGSAGEWDLIQLWYRDSYTSVGSSNGYVEGDLMRRNRAQGGATQIAWTASTYGSGDEYGFHTNTSLPTGPHNFRMYFLRVRLYRANTGAEVAFTGFEIRF